MNSMAARPRCGYQRVSGARRCVRCVTLRRIREGTNPVDEHKAGGIDSLEAWRCRNCRTENKNGGLRCFICDEPRGPATGPQLDSARRPNIAPQTSRWNKLIDAAGEVFGFLVASAIVLIFIANVIHGCSDLINNPEDMDTQLERRWARWGF